MKMLITFFTLIVLPKIILSQNCLVTIDSLKGQYVGDCKNGKANGKGTATGTDSYTGEFKNGAPNGAGKYIWKNGNCYEGQWKNGLFDGKGTLSEKNARDSIITTTGLWKKGSLVNANESVLSSPFKVAALTSNINNYNMKKLSADGEKITVFVTSTTGGGISLTGHIPPPVLSELQITEGAYTQEVPDEKPAAISNKYVFNHVTFPFRAVLYFKLPEDPHFFNRTIQQLNVEIFASGNYLLNVSLDN